jgi:hypothetical protein
MQAPLQSTHLLLTRLCGQMEALPCSSIPLYKEEEGLFKAKESNEMDSGRPHDSTQETRSADKELSAVLRSDETYQNILLEEEEDAKTD